MKIQIEDYFGGDILILKFALRSSDVSDEDIKTITGLAGEQGYDFADIDEDEEGKFIRLQQVNVDNTADDEKEELLGLVKSLTEKFL